MRVGILWAVLAACGVGLVEAGEKGEGQPLFNGKDLTGWKFRGGEAAAKRNAFARSRASSAKPGIARERRSRSSAP